ncbi:MULTISPECIES: CDP-glucose 4,6-dehydratase [unclassified Ruegeria]|uniref:CDP-glucose 4,6-dehydratase n=1 Tax=unclassified Ruegeria TaxID=2625375 RepID=UPI001488DF6A|nr:MULTISPECIES: CDP-glucose 4,6-dehydratase [unclassified Ruegeria]
MQPRDVNPNFWTGKRVLVTGHTGFKGAWLTLWLNQMGAEVTGVSLLPDSTPNLWDLSGQSDVEHHQIDIRDRSALINVVQGTKPDIVLHLAAQSLVRRSYQDPAGTFATNVMGTVHLLEAIAAAKTVQACVIVSSDKCYENREDGRSFVETDPMGGLDPYSGSKGCTELATQAMRHSFFAPYAQGGHPCRIASARAGNVIGGGDWSEDRLVPDIIRGCLGDEGRVEIRSPNAVRPWQHVLEPLRGYLMLAEGLYAQHDGHDSGWNFGPDQSDERPVIDVAQALTSALGQGRIEIDMPEDAPYESTTLRLDSSRARQIGWAPKLNFEETIRMVADWYAGWSRGDDVTALCLSQINDYQNRGSKV